MSRDFTTDVIVAHVTLDATSHLVSCWRRTSCLPGKSPIIGKTETENVDLCVITTTNYMAHAAACFAT